MAAKEMYDYLSSATADNNETLDVTPTDTLLEDCSKNQEVREGDDLSELRISYVDTPIYYATLVWDKIDESDSGTIIDFFNDVTKGNGTTKTFKWTHPTDGHTYVVRFAEPIQRAIDAYQDHGIRQAKLRVLGYVA